MFGEIIKPLKKEVVVTSTEDLIHSTKKHNVEAKKIKEDWNTAKAAKEWRNMENKMSAMQ